jgi:hypothetical protein
MWTVQPDHSNISVRQRRAVIDTSPALVWLANTEGAVEILNRRWLEYTGDDLNPSSTASEESPPLSIRCWTGSGYAEHEG